MKKLVSLILVIALALTCVLAFTACNKELYSIGVQSGTTGELYTKGDADWGFDGYSNVNTVGFTNGALAVQDMLNGGVDFVIIDEAPAKKLASGIKGIKVINILLTEEEYAFGVNKDDAALLTSVNAYLTEIKSNGTFETIVNKYFGDGTPTPVTSAAKDDSKAQLVVATNAAFPPFEYKEGNQFAGVDMEIAKGIADYLDMELVIEDMDFDAVVSSVGKNGVDIAMAGLTVSEERKKVVNFSNSYYDASQVIIVKEGDTTFDACKTTEDVVNIIKAFGEKK